MSSSSLSYSSILPHYIADLREAAIVVLDKTGTIVSWHAGIEQIFGYSSDEIIGRPVQVFFNEQDRQAGVPEQELELARTGQPADDTRWLERKDGSPVWVEGFTIVVPRHGGEPVAFVKHLRDVTEKKASDDKLRALRDALDQSSVVLCRWDCRIEHWGKGCERLYGFASREVIGRFYPEVIPVVFPISFDELKQHLLHHSLWSGEIDYPRRDGKHLTIATHCVLLRDTEGNPEFIIMTQTDATELFRVRRELEVANTKLKRMANELERSNEELSEFARIASHDLGAPLTSAGWLVDVLSSRHGHALGEDGQRCLSQVRQALDRMADLMEGILAHARAGMGAVNTSEMSDANQALQAALANLHKDIQTSHANVVSEQLPAVPITEQAMTQLLQNLISNAIKYAKPGMTPEVHIDVQPGAAMWQFNIQDNGIGVQPSWSERIFQPMQRASGTNVSGSGIGLATCKKIVNRAGGSIWVRPNEGGGSTFSFTLPRTALDSATQSDLP